MKKLKYVRRNYSVYEETEVSKKKLKYLRRFRPPTFVTHFPLDWTFDALKENKS